MNAEPVFVMWLQLNARFVVQKEKFAVKVADVKSGETILVM